MISIERKKLEPVASELFGNSEQLAKPEQEPAQEPVAIPDDVRKAAQAMQKNGYRGPFMWASMVIDFVADYAAQPKLLSLTDEEIREFDVDPVEAKLMIAKLKEKNT